jgi:plastocyanin
MKRWFSYAVVGALLAFVHIACTPAPPLKVGLDVQIDNKDVAPGADVNLTVTVTNFTLAPDKIGKEAADGEGHYRVYLDDKTGDDALATSGDKTVKVTLPGDISTGAHKLKVVLYTNDKKAVDPAVSVTVDFTVKAAGTPKVEVSAAKDTVAIGSAVKLTIKATNFTLKKVSPNPVNKAGEGHYHVYLDDKTGTDYLAASHRGDIDVSIPLDVKPGKHKLRVVLMNNDHTPITPSTSAEVEITVEGADGPLVSAKVASMYNSVPPGTEITMEISVKNFTLAKDKIGKANKDGEGHYHVYLDDNTGTNYLAAGADGTVKITVPNDTKDGEHKLVVSLRNNDHSELSPKSEAVFKFTVKKADGKPTVKLILPKTDVDTDEDLTVEIKVTNFILDPANIGKANKPGYGHYHIYIDDKKGLDYLAAGANGKVTLRIPSDLSDGEHTLRISLRNNDHSALSPVVEDKVKIQVSKGDTKVKATISPKVVFAGGDIRVSIDVSNFKLDASQIGKANKAGVGHYHIYLDNNTGVNYLAAGAATKATVTIPKGTSPGSHFLRISLRNNDHSELSSPVEVKIDFRVTEDALPKVSISSKSSEVEAGKSITVEISTQNFILDDSARGKANQLGTGHYNIYIGSNKGLSYLVTSAKGTIEIPIPISTAAGEQTLRVELQNNDGTPFTPTIEATLKIDVKPTTQAIVTATANKSTLKPGDSFEVSISTKNFKLNKNAIGKANVKGEGHYHIYLDNNTGANYLSAAADAKVSVILPASTSLGMHVLRVRLMNNDHSEYKPRTEAIIRISVEDGKPKVTASADKSKAKPGDSINLTISTKNFKLNKAAIGKANKAGEGHYHVYLDNNTGTNYLAAGADNKVAVILPVSTTPGKHTINVELRNNDHSQFKPKTVASISITVESATSKGPEVTVKPDKTTVKAGDKMKLTITVKNFTLNKNAIGKAPKAGEGHYHVYLDNNTGTNYLAAGADGTVEITIPKGTSAGQHSIKVSLRENDHSELSPKAEATFNFTVGGSAPTYKCSASYAGCTSYTDLTAAGANRTIKFGGGLGLSYSPKCIKIKVGQSVKFDGAFAGHPLKAQCEEKATITATSTGASKSFTFSTAGYYNYYCVYHASASTGSGMAGNIWVVP